MSLAKGEVEKAMQLSLEHLKQELKTLRTGRANAGMLDKVQVEMHGTRMPLKAVANVAVQESRQLLVTPFDPGSVHAIAKGIEAANLGIQPRVEGKLVRIPIPPPDEAMRKSIARQCKEFGEKAKVSLREVRRKFNDQVRKEKSSGDIAEDQMKKTEKLIQELTDRFCKEVDQACSEKEKEILTI